MLLAYQQQLDPLAVWHIPWSPLWSTLLAALPVVVLFWCLVPLRMLAPKAGLMGSIAAILVAIVVFRMPTREALMSFGYGAAFGLLPVGWTIFNAMLLYNITVETGQFTIIRRSVAGLSGDARNRVFNLSAITAAVIEELDDRDRLLAGLGGFRHRTGRVLEELLPVQGNGFVFAFLFGGLLLLLIPKDRFKNHLGMVQDILADGFLQFGGIRRTGRRLGSRCGAVSDDG